MAESTFIAAAPCPVQLAMFDFDGTLADSFPFFISVFNELAVEHGLRTVDQEDVPALRQMAARDIMRHVGLPLFKLPAVTRALLARMKEQGGGIRLFPGIGQILEQLAASGTRIAIVSSNSAENIVQVLGPTHAELVTQYECGASLFGKAARLKRVLQRAGVERADAIYVGDQSTDHEAASAAGIRFGAVAWGYADFSALRRLSPAREFAHVAELSALCLVSHPAASH